MGVGPGATATATEQIEKMQKAAMVSKLPMEQYRSLIMDLAEEFAVLGQNVSDAQATMMVVGSTLKAGVNENAVRAFASQITSERLTSGGVPQSLLTAVYAKRTFGGLSQGTQNQLNDLAKKQYGVPFTSLGAMQASTITTSNDLSRDAYVDLKRNQLNNLEKLARGNPAIAKAIAPQFIGGEYETLKSVIRGAEKGESLEALRKMEESAGIGGTGTGDFRSTQRIDDQYRDLMDKNADLWKEWHSEFTAIWKDVIGSLYDAVGVLKGFNYGSPQGFGAAVGNRYNNAYTGDEYSRQGHMRNSSANTVELPAGTFRIEYMGPPQGSNPANAATVVNNTNPGHGRAGTQK